MENGSGGVSLTEAVGRTLRAALVISVEMVLVMPRPLHPSIMVWLLPQGTHFGGNTLSSRPSRSPRNQALRLGRGAVTRVQEQRGIQ